MNTMDAIAQRRSIRRFTDQPLECAEIKRILEAAVLAPSGKNRQPWRFVVLTEDARTHLANLIDRSCESIAAQGGDTGSAPGSARIIRTAPVTVVVLERELPPPWKQFEEGARIVDAQSIGAAIQNMCLAATAEDLGSLWIADVLYAEDAITAWLGTSEERLIAAVSLGHPDEAPDARPRRPLEETVAWRSEAG